MDSIWACRFFPGCRLDLYRSFSPDRFLCPTCCCFFFCFSISLLSLFPSPAYCRNSLFICCLQRVALSLEDDGYPWGGDASSPPPPPPPPPQSHPGPSSHHSLYTTTMRPVQRRGEREGVLICLPFKGAGMTCTSCISPFLSRFLHWSNITTTTSQYYFPLVLVYL